MRLYPIKTPELIQRMYPEFLWRFSSTKKEIYLTFDDGPTPNITEFVLEQLALFNAKATFFCIGKNIVENSKILSKILKDGHTIGNHTNNHLKGWNTKRKTYLENVLIAQKYIDSHNSKADNQQLKLFRPPYGKVRKMQVKDLQNYGYKIVMWDVLSGDWDNKISKERCLRNVIENTTSGSIVVFHDSKKAEANLKYVLPKLLAHFSKKGYIFKQIV